MLNQAVFIICSQKRPITKVRQHLEIEKSNNTELHCYGY